MFGLGTNYTITPDKLAVKCKQLFMDFVMTYRASDNREVYLDAIRDLGDPETSTLAINFSHLEEYNDKLSQAIVQHYYRVYPHLCSAVKEMVATQTEAMSGMGSVISDVNDCESIAESAISIVHAHSDLTTRPLTRRVNNNRKQQVHPCREFFVGFVNMASTMRLRELSSTKIGSLAQIMAQVVRTHPVHPELISGYFICADCHTPIPDVPQQFKYTQPVVCANSQCSNRSRFTLDLYKSRFADFQRVRIQECQQEIPRGAIPRTLDVIIRSTYVETAQAGDKCEFVGCLVAVPDVSAISLPGQQSSSVGKSTISSKAARIASNAAMNGSVGTSGVSGLRSLGVRSLKYRLAFLACSCRSITNKFKEPVVGRGTIDDIRKSVSDSTWQRVYEISRDKNLLQNLSSSLFPSIHGCEEVKQGILLQLFGGVPKRTMEGTSLRGDINICLVGDPSTAKSQFLKQLSEFAPRAVYTSGKASSAAGLTAAVVKDEDSFEFVIEAGALMLADNGICCIDEFDKMDRRDQVAIHEAMEQQTISITKAGVKATLNAHASILAAANPIGGRYNRSKSLRQNISLSEPIMSRFDLFFVLIDQCNEIVDYSVAQQLVRMHCHTLELPATYYTFEDLRTYISVARLFNPQMTKNAQNRAVAEYLQMRTPGGGFGSSNGSFHRFTVRQLESIIRLSEAVARMY